MVAERGLLKNRWDGTEEGVKSLLDVEGRKDESGWVKYEDGKKLVRKAGRESQDGGTSKIAHVMYENIAYGESESPSDIVSVFIPI